MAWHYGSPIVQHSCGTDHMHACRSLSQCLRTDLRKSESVIITINVSKAGTQTLYAQLIMTMHVPL